MEDALHASSQLTEPKNPIPIPSPSTTPEEYSDDDNDITITNSMHEDNDGDEEVLFSQDQGYNSSESSADEILAQMNSRASSRSSFSSIPESVGFRRQKSGSKSLCSPVGGIGIHGDGDNNGKLDETVTGTRMGTGILRSLHNLRERENAFRHPSSVRAMQMHTEDEDDGDEEVVECLTPPRRRMHGNGHPYPSPGPSPLKRSPYFSPTRGRGRTASSNKHHHHHQQNLKKEYPLVLLHCNLLSPTLSLPAAIGVPSQKILKDVLPPRYWRRWKLLEEKIGFGVVRDRGVLISHPQDMYDLLEERLLESLELQRPRLQGGHFLGPDEEDAESEKEDGNVLQHDEDHEVGVESDTDSEQGDECPDCGRRVVQYNNNNNSHKRKWEIRVFAANGLMRAGAWAAAWKEMEKVDVEVGLWLPSDVKRELERRAWEACSFQRQQVLMDPVEDGFGKAVYPTPTTPISTAKDTPTQDQIDGLDEPPKSASSLEPTCQPQNPSSKATDIDLQTLLINYLRILASDRRNIAIAILSLLVVVFAFAARQGGEVTRPLSKESLLDSGPGPSPGLGLGSVVRL